MRAAADSRRTMTDGVRPALPLWAALPVAAVAGAIMDLAYPAAGIWPAAFVAVALLLLALRGRRTAGALLVGLVYGMVFFLLLVSWTSRYLGPIPWFALAGVQAALTAVLVIPLSWAYRWVPRALPARTSRVVVLPLVIAALWVVRELVLGSWPYGGFPWARIAVSQAESPVAPLTSWIGISGVGFVMVFAVAAAVEVFRVVRSRTWLVLVPAFAMVVLVATPLYQTPETGTIRIGAVQGNGPTAYFDAREGYDVIEAQLAAGSELSDDDLDLLVWPEGAIGGDPFENRSLAAALTAVVRETGAPLLANTATSVGEKIFNTSFLWSADDRVGTTRDEVPTHAKRHPVPFGEYVPDRDFYAAIVPDLIGLLQREYTAGTDVPLVEVDGTKVGLAICFDVIYDDVIHAGIDAGAEVLVFQTNNADFRGTDENLQQLAIARMRAIETGRTVVNISTVGTSQVIAPDGSTEASVGVDVAGTLVGDVPLHSSRTPAMLFGSALQLLIALGGMATLAVSWGIGRRREQRAGAAALSR